MLPQSPQLFKRVLMVSGSTGITRLPAAFVTKTLRNDRQPEFTQIDLEMSFVDREQVMSLMERDDRVRLQGCRRQLPAPFPRMTYAEAMGRYGSDKPDLRFDMPLHDVTATAAKSDFKVFKDAATKAGLVQAFDRVRRATIARSRIDALGETAKSFGAKGLAWLKVTAEGRLELRDCQVSRCPGFAAALPEGETGDLVLGADKPAIVHDIAGADPPVAGEELNA